MMRTIVNTLMVQSAAGGLLIAFMLLVRKLCAEKISARLMYALWLLVALRMLVPLELPGLIHTDKSASVVQNALYTSEAGFLEAYVEWDGETMPRAAEAEKEIPASFPSVNEKSVEQAEENPSATVQELCIGRISLYTAAFYGWLGGVFLTGAYMLATNLCYMRRVKKQAVPVHTKCALPVYRAEVESPFLAGVFRKRIYVNEAARQEGRLSYILAHEEEHSRNQDNLWLLLRNVVCALYWFHPLVWIAAALSTRDCEKACDERVISSLSKSERVDYAQILFEMSVGQNRYLPMLSAISAEKGEASVRIARILQGQPIKRWVSVLTAALMMISSITSCATGEAEGKDSDAGAMIAQTPILSAGPERMTMLIENEVFVGKEDEWVSLGKYPGGKLVAVGEEDLFLCAVREDREYILVLNPDGSEKKAHLLPDEMHLKHMVYAGGKLFMTVQTADSYEVLDYMSRGGSMYVMDMQSGTVAPAKYGTVFDLCADEKGEVYVIRESDTDNEWDVLRISHRDGSSDRIFSMYPMEVTQIAADVDGLYLYREGNIDCFDFDSEEQTRIIYDAGELRNLIYGNGGLYACGSDGRIRRFDTSDTDDQLERTLTIANYLSKDSIRAIHMQKWFDQEYPDVQLSYITVSRDKLATRMMAGDTEIDMVWGESSLIMKMVPSGAYLPLDGMEQLHRSMEESGFVEYQAALSHGGKLYGVPDMVSFFAIGLNEPLLKSLNLDWPQAPYSYEELADWAVDALEGTPYFLIPDDFSLNPAHLYLDACFQEAEEVNLNTQEFRKSMEAYRRLWQAGLICTGGEDGEALATGERLSHAAYTSMPTLQERSVSLAQIHAFFVTANTKNKDMAEAYLAEWVSADCQNKASYGIPSNMLLEDASGYVRNKLNDFEYPAAAEDMRLKGYESIVLYRRNQDMTTMMAIDEDGDMDAYLNGSIDIDEFIRKMQPKLDMIQYE